jgi:hypothetical protein
VSTQTSVFESAIRSGATTSDTPAHRQHAMRDRLIDREVRRLELIQRAKREAAAEPARPDTPSSPPRPR